MITYNTDKLAIGDVATVKVDGNIITGIVYYVNPSNDWPCVKTPCGRIASGPVI